MLRVLYIPRRKWKPCKTSLRDFPLTIHPQYYVHSLQRMVLTPYKRYYKEHFWISDEKTVGFNGRRYWLESGQEIARKKLQDKVPSGAKLVLISPDFRSFLFRIKLRDLVLHL